MRDELTTGQAAKLLGISRTHVQRAIVRGRLKARREETGSEHRQYRYRIARAELAAWMVAEGMDPRTVRGHFHPDGALLLVCCEPALQSALAGVWTVGLPSLFHLGRAVVRERAWGVVVDLPAVNSVDAHRAFYAYAKESDRPELVGLHGDDMGAHTRDALAEVFDVLLPKAIGPARQAQRIRRLHPCPEVGVDATPTATP